MIANPTKATGSFIAMRLTQPRVRTRLFAGFGVLIMLAAGIAGLSIERQAEMSSRLTTMDSKAKSLRRLDETALLLESTRRAALRFEFDADPTALKTVRTDLAAIAEILARQTLAAAPMEQQQADMSLGKNLPIYAGQFERLVELQSMTAGLLAKLSDTGPSLTEKVAQLADAARAAADPELLPAAIVVGQAITRLRRDGLGFLTSGDPAWHSTILADREDAGAGLLALEAIADDATRPIAANLTATLSVLGGHFEAAVAARSESASLYSSVMLPEMIAMQDQIRQARQT